MTDDIIVVVETQPVFSDVFPGGAQFTGGGTGTVTSVGLSMPSGLIVSGSPITHSGTLTVTTALSGVVHASAGGFTAGLVDLASEVTGALSIIHGGTGQVTANAALNALLPVQSASTFLRSDGTNTSFSVLVGADIPNISAAIITSGTLPVVRGGTGSGVANTALNNLLPAQVGNAGKALVTDGTNTSWTAIAGGTVTSVGISGSNGLLVSSSPVTSSGTIALDLGNITPLSVAASGTVTGFNLSGTNTGDVTLAGQNYLTISGQVVTAHPVDVSGSNITGILVSTSFPALSGDVSTSPGSVVTTIGVAAVTYSKIQNVTSARLLGRYSAGSGVVQEITVGSGINLSVGGVLSATGSGGTVTSVDVSVSDGLTVSGNPITSLGTLAFGISTNGVAYDRLAQAGANTLLGNNTGSTANVIALSVSQTKTMLALNLVENTALSTWGGSGNIITVGTITTGAWNGSVIGPAYGGTGVNNGTNTITLAGALVTSGANSLTFTTTGTTNVTLPTSGTLVNSAVTILSSLAQVGTITVGTWHGTPIGLAYGGSGQTTANDSLNAFLPSQTSNSGKFLQTDGSNTSWVTVSGSGTVTSVAMTVPAELSVAGSPITTSGTLALTWATQTANKVFSGPSSGGAATPGFRALVAADIPSLDASVITTGALAVARGGTNLSSYTLGDMLYCSAANVLSKLAGNTTSARQFLTQTGTGSVSATPIWEAIAAADMPVFIASGGSHAAGAVPDPGSSAGTTKFLREDATWQVPTTIGSPITSGTSGSIVYIDSSVHLAQDNSNLFWDATNHRLGLGLTTPGTTLHVKDSITVGKSGTATGVLKMNGTTSGTITITPTANAGTQNYTIRNQASDSFFVLSNTSGGGANLGTGTLSGGTVTINTSYVLSGSLIFLTDTSNGVNLGTLSVGTIVPGVSFVVNSSNALDASSFNWFIINP